MATLGGTELSAMPTVWRHFCIVVDPPVNHDGDSVRIFPPMTPEEGRISYAVALPFTPKQRVGRPFDQLTDDSGQKTSRRLDSDGMDRLRDTCERLLRRWQQLEEADPGFRDRAFKEFQDNWTAEKAKREGKNKDGNVPPQSES